MFENGYYLKRIADALATKYDVEVGPCASDLHRIALILEKAADIEKEIDAPKTASFRRIAVALETMNEDEVAEPQTPAGGNNQNADPVVTNP